MLEDEVGRQLGEDLLELLGALGRVVLAAGLVGDRGQRLLVDRAPEAAARAAEPAAAAELRVGRAVVARLRADELGAAARRPLARVRRPEADRVDAQPAIGRLRAASIGSGPALLAPSVSSTMIAGA